MLSAVQLNNQSMSKAAEISDIISYRHLSPELDAEHGAISENAPELELGFGHFPSHAACAIENYGIGRWFRPHRSQYISPSALDSMPAPSPVRRYEYRRTTSPGLRLPMKSAAAGEVNSSSNVSLWDDTPESRRGGERAAVCAACDFYEFVQFDAQLADCEVHVLVRNLIELGRRFLIERACTLEVSALRVEDRDGGLDQSLVEEFQLAVGALPDFFPCFVALEEATFIEKIDPLFEEV